MTAPPPPHPRDSFILGSGQGFLEDMVQTFVNGWQECGDVIWFRAPRPMYVLAHPDDLRHVLDEHHDHHPRSGYVRKMLVNIMGHGVFTVDDAEWRHQLPLVQPPFAAERVPDYFGVMKEATAAMLARWQSHAEDRSSLDIQAEMMRLGLDTIGEILWGDEWRPQSDVLVRALLESSEFAIPRVTGFPTPLERLTAAYRRFKRGRATLDAAIYEAIAVRRREPRDDLISTFVHAHGATPDERLSDEEAHDAVTSAIFGVYKGPPIALTWTWYLLSKNPHVRRRLEAELSSELGGRDPDVDDLRGLRYTSMVIHEVLRLYPTLWLMSRPPREAEVIGGYQIPQRVYLIAMPYITHRHPDFWPNPEGFDPERFTPERSAGRHPFAYIPFGRAHRACIGESLTMMQMSLAIAMIAQRFRLELVPGYRVERRTEFLMRPTNGLPMTLRARAPATASAPTGAS